MKSTRTSTEPFLISERELADFVLEEIDTAIVICDKQKSIVLANPAAQKLYGGDPVGHAFEDAFQLKWLRKQGGVQNNGHFTLEPALKGQDLSGLCELVRPGQPRCNVLVKSSPYQGPKDEVLCCIVSMMDVTAAEIAEQRKLTQSQIADVLAESNTLDEAAPRILRALCEGLGWDLAALWQMDKVTGLLRPLSIWHRAGDERLADFAAATRGLTLANGKGLPGRVWKQRQAVWIQDVRYDDNFPRADAAMRADLCSAFGFPLVSGGQEVGVLEALTRATLAPDDQVIALGREIATELGFFLLRQESARDVSRLAALVRDSQDAILAKDLNGIILDWNPAAEHLYGYTRDEIVGKSVGLLFAPEAPLPMETILEAVRRGETIQNHDTIRLRKDGSHVDVSVTISPLRDEAGNIIAASTIARDITDRKELEQAQQRATNILNAVVEGTTDGIYVKDLDGRYLMINQAGAAVSGRTVEQVVGKRLDEVFDPETATQLRADDELVIRSGRAQTLENVIPSPDGKRIFESVKAPYRNSEGEIIGTIGVSRDVSELRRAQAELVRQAALLDLSPDAIIEREPGGKILYWNRGASQLYGWSAEEAVGHTSHELFQTGFPETKQEQQDRLAAEGRWEGELVHHTRAGNAIVVSSRQVVRRNGDNVPTAILEINEDITERKRREAGDAFLLQATNLLTASLDLTATFENITELAVPTLADWSAVHTLTEDGMIRRLAFAHYDPAEVARVAARPSEYPLDPNAKHLVPHVLITGVAEFLNDVPGTVLQEAARDEEHLDTLRHLGLKAYLCIPLQARGRTLGTVTFVMSDSGRRYESADVELAKELVRRAGLAADNASLYQESNAAQARLQLVAEASNELLGSMDYETRLERLARLLVPRFADWCTINLVEPDGSIRLAALAHAQPEMVPIIEEWAARHPLSPDEPTGTPRVIRTGKAELVSDISQHLRSKTEMGGASAGQEYLERLRVQSSIIVPLIARGRTLGAMTFVHADSGRRFTRQDLVLGEEIARRAAIALDNASLFLQEQHARHDAEENARRIGALQNISAALGAALAPTRVAQIALEQGTQAIGAVAGSVALLGGDQQSIELVQTLGIEPGIVEAWRTFPLTATTPVAEAIRTGELVLLSDTEAMLARYPDIFSRQTNPIGKAWAAVPLIFEGRVLGALALTFSQERQFDARDEAFLNALAQQSAQAMERARLYQAELKARAQAERAAERSEWLTKAGSVLSRSLDYEKTLAELAELVTAKLADWCQIHIAKEDGTAEQLVLTHRDPEKVKSAVEYGKEIKQYFTPRWDAPQGLPNVLRTGKSETYDDIPDSLLVQVAQNEVQLEILRGTGYSSVMIVPFNIQGRTLGAMTLINTESRRHFNDEDLALAELVAERAAVAIENARLYRETQSLNTTLEGRVEQRTYELSQAYQELSKEVVERRRAEEMTRALLRISNRLNSTLAVETSLDILIQEAIRVMNGKSGFAGLRTAQGMRMHKFYAHGKSIPVEYTWQPGQDLPGWVLEHGKPYMTNDAPNDPVILHDLSVNQGVTSAICTPILDAQNQVVGFFAVQDKNDGTPFTRADVEFLMALSPIASIALENAQAYQKISEAESAVQDSFGQLRALAARLQTIREEERTDMARELHDELGQALTALKMDTAALINRLPQRSKQLRERAQAMSEQIDSTIKTVRRMSSQLRPGMLDDLGLGPSIEWYAQEFQTRTGIAVETDVTPEELELDHTRATALYRIFQETLTNVARHAHATLVKAKLELQDHVLVLRIADNGQGFDPVEVRGKRSLGLLGMRERAEMAQGTLEIEGAPGQGTTITVRLDLGQEPVGTNMTGEA